MKNVKPVNKPKLKTIRRLQRNHPTSWEWKLWQYLKDRQIDGYKFRRQVSIENYVVDFCSLDLKLIIEVDGSGHLHPKQQKKEAMFYKLTEVNVIKFFKNIQHEVGHKFILVSIKYYTTESTSDLSKYQGKSRRDYMSITNRIQINTNSVGVQQEG